MRRFHQRAVFIQLAASALLLWGPTGTTRGEPLWPAPPAALPLDAFLLDPGPGMCLPQGTSRSVVADLVLLDHLVRGDHDTAALQAALATAILCVVVDGGASPLTQDCVTLASQMPPVLPPLSPGCHSARIEIRSRDLGRHAAAGSLPAPPPLVSSDEVKYRYLSLVKSHYS